MLVMLVIILGLMVLNNSGKANGFANAIHAGVDDGVVNYSSVANVFFFVYFQVISFISFHNNKALI